MNELSNHYVWGILRCIRQRKPKNSKDLRKQISKMDRRSLESIVELISEGMIFGKNSVGSL